ncbi:DEAD/DEAH box helicase [Pontibacter lucknowensis]|uniref:Superfamily II DNA or RNA helicase n=1 Tax=Pontibacter lucknowensis TaxID=1077936 RepID=A0A1N6WIK7_9BACT|nr:DEAD/DEAH box helicase [Pontibacter lucknowensis]SIQ89997.1 Superfamily II DNA or RNA helicase [Pontibacter lucknowensis]
MLKEGIYEQLITTALKDKIDALSTEKFFIAQAEIDKEEAAQILSEYMISLIQLALRELKKDDLKRQVLFCNEIIQFIDEKINLEASDSLIYHEGQILTAVLSKIGKTDKQLVDDLNRKIPQTGLSVSNLFTESNSDISIDTEIERDILSADKIYWIVSFIRWSGLRIFERALKEFTSREGAELRIITTSYMGATEARALDFLSKLPNTHIKISYQTKIERLHAKAYIFERNTNFNTAFIGSSNLSKSALTKGLEWNLRVTSQENPHIIEKAKATFDHYWNSIDFEDLAIGGITKFKEAIQQEKQRDNVVSLTDYFKINPFPFQKEVLEKLKVERELYNNYRNLVVAATGTGKTIISAFDYQRFYLAQKGKANLLFIAHRKEILEQAIASFRAVLGAGFNDFGQLWVGNHTPQDGDLKHLFVSIQTFNSQKELFQERFSKDYYDFIIIDEAHHSQAETYRIIFELFDPNILLGLTATPERMDGRSLLPDFNNKIAAEIRLADALTLKLLSPFQYFCISDEKSVNLKNVRWEAGRYNTTDLTAVLSTKQRAALILDAVEHYLTDPFESKTLGFCSSKAHAQFMSDAFNAAGYRAISLVSGNGNDTERATIRQRLIKGEVNFVFVVDIFNEGVDIPEIDTVLFLRPTESLTVFLQQLGRGLRISEGKECLTVLDFVSQAHVNYNFADKFRALAGRSRFNIQKEIENNFPHLPPGCNIRMEKQAKEYILENIKNAVFNLRRLRREVTNFKHHTHQELTLANFLLYHHLDIRTVYSTTTWSELKRDAGILNYEKGEYHFQIEKGLKRVVQIDSPSYLHFIASLIERDFVFTDTDVIENQFALMLYYDIWQKGVGEYGFTTIAEGLRVIENYPVLKDELREIVSYLRSQLDHTTKSVTLTYPLALELHARYSRDEILCAFGKTTPERAFPSQEGVINIPALNTELLLVTLNKADKDFSPSTQYEDYAINEKIFHWQSQNKTAPESPVGLSYIRHRENMKQLLLFVREEKKDTYGFTSPYYFLGPVDYVSHKGSKPMSINWELHEPMPAFLWKGAAKMAVG